MFDAAFEHLVGYPPFRWQRRLFNDHFSCGDIPRACDIPTGLGKTATMAVWLIARSLGAELPRRLIYVVDRRAVVDQATTFAETLRERASDALDIDDLPISTLRGQFADNGRWRETPHLSAIVVGTIDMIGSRLLFSGYGVSTKMRPYHAALLGVDALVVLDEAHLCPAFESLVDSIAKDKGTTFGPRSFHDRKIIPSFELMSLSATGRDLNTVVHDNSAIFRLEPNDRNDSLVNKRLSASKCLRLCDDVEPTKLASSLAERALTIGTRDGPARVIVYCDRRKDADKVKKQIDKHLKKQGSGASELMVGARRVFEREKLSNWLKSHGFIEQHGSPTDDPRQPKFLIATSAGEVGVDMDADRMVCDLVSWERMVQRLGRVNRRGESQNGAMVDVVPVGQSQPKAGASDAHTKKYEEANKNLQALKAPLEKLPRMENGRYDATPANLAAITKEYPELAEAAMTPTHPHPELTRALVDAWSLTSLKTHPGRPDIQPWLRGWEGDEPQTAVVWRQLLPWAEGDPAKRDVNQFFSVARVHLLETLEAPTHQVFDLLVKRGKKAADIRLENDVAPRLKGDSPVAILLDRKGEFKNGWTLECVESFARISSRDKKKVLKQLQGSTIVVSSKFGGLREDGMLDDDVASVPSTLDGLDGSGWSDEVLEEIGYRVATKEQELDDTVWRLDTTITLSQPERSERGTAETLRVFVARNRTSTAEGNLAISRKTQKLEDHHAWTEEQARQVAEDLQLPPEYRDMLRAASRYHDLGKKRDLWQNAMNAPADGRPYAKTKKGGHWRRLAGYRHEFGSLREIEVNGLLNDLSDELRYLALHLVCAHHGYSRPTINPFDPGTSPTEQDQMATAATLRFALLQRRWGPWGLAWWEALLRSSDQCASAGA